MTVQLETDSTSAGPKGRVSAALKDADGKTLATATSDEIGTGGKPPGKSAIRNFSSEVRIDPAITGECGRYILMLNAQGQLTDYGISNSTQ